MYVLRRARGERDWMVYTGIFCGTNIAEISMPNQIHIRCSKNNNCGVCVLIAIFTCSTYMCIVQCAMCIYGWFFVRSNLFKRSQFYHTLSLQTNLRKWQPAQAWHSNHTHTHIASSKQLNRPNPKKSRRKKVAAFGDHMKKIYHVHAY